jgi:hypothetical protein
MLKAGTLFIALLFCVYAKAQTAADSASVKYSPLKTLSYEQYNSLLKGQDIYGMPLVATLNHYPMPDMIIKYKSEMDLSPGQVSRISAIAKELHRKRLEMGLIIINNERTLDSLFRTRQLNNGVIIFYANRYGLYQGEMRNAILQACYNTANLLSPGQIKQLEVLEDHK